MIRELRLFTHLVSSGQETIMRNDAQKVSLSYNISIYNEFIEKIAPLTSLKSLVTVFKHRLFTETLLFCFFLTDTVHLALKINLYNTFRTLL